MKKCLGFSPILFLLTLLAACGGSQEFVNLGAAQTPAPTNQVQVDGRSVTAVVVTPSDPTLLVGNTLQFKAMATFSDGTRLDVTADSAWDTSATAVATVDSTASTQGMIKGIKSGLTFVNATYKSVKGSAALLVTTADATDAKIFCLYYEDLPVTGDMDYNDAVFDLRGDVTVDGSVIVSNSPQTLSIRMYESAGCDSLIDIKAMDANGTLKSDLTFHSHGKLPTLQLDMDEHDQLLVTLTPLDYCKTGDSYSLPSKALKLETVQTACNPNGP